LRFEEWSGSLGEMGEDGKTEGKIPGSESHAHCRDGKDDEGRYPPQPTIGAANTIRQKEYQGGHVTDPNSAKKIEAAASEEH
jgi:hypothetical protein